MCNIDIRLIFDHGFSGCSFGMWIKNEFIWLCRPPESSEEIARTKARVILMERFGQDFGIDEMKFKWNGSMG